jgi:hypothetical protein
LEFPLFLHSIIDDGDGSHLLAHGSSKGLYGMKLVLIVTIGFE